MLWLYNHSFSSDGDHDDDVHDGGHGAHGDVVMVPMVMVVMVPMVMMVMVPMVMVVMVPMMMVVMMPMMMMVS
ncbi:hypothetical protein TNCT_292821 [Trichonephila clavata]|uniref:Uncharacterized protein n=1 Tax=Trichonephila clavata TaxID=2740835 RepID=A0A8X6GMK4_TRICU|nr:hypothetical protein TNCT_292821 [Trichonephila clavata]